MFPFQENISNGVLSRTFDRDVPATELVWHRDENDRIVKVIESTGWYFQFDDELPFSLRPGDVLNIPKEKWHRVIRKENSSKLIVEIVEMKVVQHV